MIERWVGWALVALLSAGPVGAWGPQAHALLGRAGAEMAGMGEREAELLSTGAYLADLDHTLRHTGPVGDSRAYSWALMRVAGRSASSDRWALGWLSHALAQDTNQGPIASSKLKLYADLILGRRHGPAIAGALYDADRIRQAVRALGGDPPTGRAVRRGVERLVVLGIMEGLLVDVLPVEIARSETSPEEGSNPAERPEETPLFDLVELTREPFTSHISAGSRAATETVLPPGFPPQLGALDAQWKLSLQATHQMLIEPPDPPADGAPSVTARQLDQHGSALAHIPAPSARLLGLRVVSVEAEGGLWRTTATLPGKRRFKAAVGILAKRVARELFPRQAPQWGDLKERVSNRTEALATYLAGESERLERLFPEKEE